VSIAAASGGVHHTVRYGETLYSIGRYYGVNPYYIADVNNLYNPNHIYAGQVLYIPTYHACDGYYGDYGYDCGHRPDYGYCDGTCHVVAYGETLSSIGYYYGVSPWAIASANHIYNLNRIYAGQVLYIPMGYY
jgi:spore germination protein